MRATLWTRVALVVVLAYARASAQDCERPKLEELRSEEDYSFLEDPACRTDVWDWFKYIALPPDGAYLTLGGELRERYELVRNANWGRDPVDENGYVLHRFMVLGDFHFHEHVRVYVHLFSDFIFGRAGGPRPMIDEDRFDIHEAFADLTAGPFALRLGRQELQYGSARLISIRESPNVRLSFDGARVRITAGDWRTDVLAVRPADTNLGVLDDVPDPHQTLWGVYAVGPVIGPATSAKLGVDAYYLGLSRDEATVGQGTAPELRHTLGTRIWGTPEPVDYNCELFYQFGRWDHGALSAWAATCDGGYTLRNTRYGLTGGITSGDRDPANPDLGTYYSMFATGRYFGEAALLGPMNHMNINPSVDFKLTDEVEVTSDVNWFWRYSTNDALYTIDGQPQVSGTLTSARFVGTQFTVGTQWQPTARFTIQFVYTHFFAGPFLVESGVGRDVDFIAFWADYRI